MDRKLRQLTTRMLATLALFLCGSNSWSLTTGAANRTPMDVSVYDYDGTAHAYSVEDRQAAVTV